MVLPDCALCGVAIKDAVWPRGSVTQGWSAVVTRHHALTRLGLAPVGRAQQGGIDFRRVAAVQG